jgi:hypothetical protein
VQELKLNERPLLVTAISLYTPKRPDIVTFLTVSRLNYEGNVTIILHPEFNGIGLEKPIYIMLLSPTMPAVVLSFDASTENKA